MDSLTSLVISSYNCHGFNKLKTNYISSLLLKCTFLLLQELWLSDEQLKCLSSVSPNIAYTGIAGFDNSEVLAGRPFGGCAILWHSNVMARVSPLIVNSRRVCAVRVSFDSDYVKILIVNVYMPYEDGDENIDDFVSVLAVIEELISSNSDCHVVIGGDFNVDFCRDRTHTALLNSFIHDSGLIPADRHADSHIDYTYKFNMLRFSILDHFILSGTLFEESVTGVSVLHEVDNLSDHDPISLCLNIDVKILARSDRVYIPCLSWAKAGYSELFNYSSLLSLTLQTIQLPVDALLCTDLCCKDASHHKAVGLYAEAITSACVSAAVACIPCTKERHSTHERVPGWRERGEPFREKSLLWHRIWIDCGRPRNGVVADCMRRTRAKYHYAVREVKKKEELIVRERIAEALINDPSRSFWAELKKIRHCKSSNSIIVDGCTDEASIAMLFASKYRSLYNSVSFDKNEMQQIINELDTRIKNERLSFSNYCFTNRDVSFAITKLNAHKNEGSNNGLSTDHIIHAGTDLSQHIAFLFTCMATHGSVPSEFGISTILPIPKSHNSNSIDSSNFRGIALSSVLCKLLDNIILDKFHDYLCTSDHQFGFKSKSSTNMCTMVLKETLAYYRTNQSSVYCTFLDASKAFDRVHYCKLFRLLINRGLPACIVRLLAVLYTSSQVRVLWAGLVSDYFSISNGVKQGGVISPVLFCVYMDDLLLRLSSAGVGCYLGLNFVGALAYADDIVLLAPTPYAMRKLLQICDTYAAEFDVSFNPDKSKCLVIPAHKRRHMDRAMCNCFFFIGNRRIENVDSFSHLGHIITSSMDDTDDIQQRRNSFIGQTNNVLCFFNKLNTSVKLQLFKSYCCSFYGSELWSLDNIQLDNICGAWRKALRRILQLPYKCHSYLLPILSDSLPIFDDICKRSMRFIANCVASPSHLVKSISWHCILFGRQRSFIGSNALFCCERYKWSMIEFINNSSEFNNFPFNSLFYDSLTEMQKNSASFLFELLSIREGHIFLPQSFLSYVQLSDIIDFISTV